MSLRSRPPAPSFISDRPRRLASQSPSPERSSNALFNSAFNYGGGDYWYCGQTGVQEEIFLTGDAGNGPAVFCDEPDGETQSNATDVEQQFGDFYIPPPSKFVDGCKNDDSNVELCYGDGRRLSRERRKSQTDRNRNGDTANESIQHVGPYLGAIGKGRGRPIYDEANPPTENGKRQVFSRFPEQFNDAPPRLPAFGRGYTPPHLHPKGRGTGRTAERKSTDGDFVDNSIGPLPPPSLRDLPSDESIESKPSTVDGPSSQFRDAEDCCGGIEESPSPRLNVSSPRIKGHYLRRARQYSEIGKKDFGKARYIDTHCHLDLLLKRDGFHGTFSEYITKKRKETWAMCYEGCIADFCYPVSFETIKPFWESLMEEPGVYAAFGCHPHVASDYNDQVEKFIVDRLSHDKVIALGEMGLDYSRNNQQNHDLQKTVFKKQLQLAITYDKPLVIHCREAEDDCYEIMKEIVPHDHRIHRHCFTGSLEDSRRWTDYFTKLKIGLTTGIYEPRDNQLTLLKEFPLDRILIETDSPYFLPRYARREEFGRLEFNHPGIGYVVAAKLAEVRNIEMSEVLKVIRENTRALYQI